MGNVCKEPPANKVKLDPLSPHADLTIVAQNIRSGVLEPLNIFLLFFTVDLLAKICDLTNIHAWEVILFDPTFASEDGSWDEITVKEMHAFIAIVLIMRRHQDVGFGSFWRELSEKSGHWPRAIMKRSRFFAILQLLTLKEHPVKDDPQVTEFLRQEFNLREDETIGEQRSQFCRNNDSSDVRQLQYLFDQIKKVFEVFLQSCEIHLMEKISSEDGSSNQDNFFNYMKIISSPRRQSDKKTREPSTIAINPKSDPASCHQKASLLENTDELQADVLRPENGFILVNGQAKWNKKGAIYTQDGDRHHKLPPNILDNSISEHHPHVSNIICLCWQDECLNITVNNSSEDETMQLLSGNKTEETSLHPSQWHKVFIPCPEVIYKDNDRTQDCPSANIGISFFYHYLNLALYFSTTSAVQCLASASGCSITNGGLSGKRLEDQLIDGLVLLGESISVIQSDSDSEMRETDVSYDTTSDQDSDTKSDKESDFEGTSHKPHKYIQARSRIRQKCALCWSLHHKARMIRSRCSRCRKHFCLSRFRNCMQEVHDNSEVMKRILEEESV